MMSKSFTCILPRKRADGPRFGNFIGEPVESDEESQHGANGHDTYVFDNESDEDGAPNDQQLMEIDGMDKATSKSTNVS